MLACISINSTEFKKGKVLIVLSSAIIQLPELPLNFKISTRIN